MSLQGGFIPASESMFGLVTLTVPTICLTFKCPDLDKR